MKVHEDFKITCPVERHGFGYKPLIGENNYKAVIKRLKQTGVTIDLLQSRKTIRYSVATGRTREEEQEATVPLQLIFPKDERLRIQGRLYTFKGQGPEQKDEHHTRTPDITITLKNYSNIYALHPGSIGGGRGGEEGIQGHITIEAPRGYEGIEKLIEHIETNLREEFRSPQQKEFQKKLAAGKKL